MVFFAMQKFLKVSFVYFYFPLGDRSKKRKIAMIYIKECSIQIFL